MDLFIRASDSSMLDFVRDINLHVIIIIIFRLFCGRAVQSACV